MNELIPFHYDVIYHVGEMNAACAVSCGYCESIINKTDFEKPCMNHFVVLALLIFIILFVQFLKKRDDIKHLTKNFILFVN